jgi:hypothetical protein
MGCEFIEEDADGRAAWLFAALAWTGGFCEA